MKDEALTPVTYKMQQLPVAVPSGELREQVEERVRRILVLEDERLTARAALLDWLAVEHGVGKPSQKLADPLMLSATDLVAEVRRLRGKKNPLSAAGLKNLREEHARSIAPFAELQGETDRLEAELAERIYQAYGLTGEEIQLLWQTAPPRMPGRRLG